VLEIRSLAEEPSDEDRRIAQTLLAERSAEALVAALVRSRRDARPAPEELTVPPSMRPRGPERPQRAERVDRRRAQQPFEGPDRRKPRPERTERTERPGRPERPERGERPQRPERGERRGPMTGNNVWFTVNVGRSKHADPKWLIPLLCRRGNVTKQAIGKIQILTRETRVEIASDAADRFAEAVRRPDPKDPRIHIEPLDREA
jgi:ATP-dependent RNA helicase DeaD